MNKLAEYLLFALILSLAWFSFRSGLQLTFGLEVPEIGGPDGWKPLVGNLLVAAGMYLYHRFNKWVNEGK